MSYEDFTEYGDHPKGYLTLYNLAVETMKDKSHSLQAVEVGVRAGGSALTLLNAIKDTDPDRYLHTIDPHGSKPYLSRELLIPEMYNDREYRETMFRLSSYCLEHKLSWSHWKMKSLDWCKVYAGIEFWGDRGQLSDDFCFVHLDGDHNTTVVANELKWFTRRTRGLIVIDDADQLDLTDKRIAKYKGQVTENYLIITCS